MKLRRRWGKRSGRRNRVVEELEGEFVEGAVIKAVEGVGDGKKGEVGLEEKRERRTELEGVDLAAHDLGDVF